MKRLYRVLMASTVAVWQLTAFGLGDLGIKLPSKPEDLISLATGGGAALACNQALKGESGRAAATLICGSLGVLVGNGIKQYLKDREQVRLAEATNATLTTGKKQTVRTEEGSELTTELVKPVKATEPGKPKPKPAPEAPATAQVATAEGECNTVRQTVVTADNQRFEEDVTACRKGDKWTVKA